jgi:hypothetical protein
MIAEEHPDGGCKCILTPENDDERKALKVMILNGSPTAVINCAGSGGSSVATGYVFAQEDADCCTLTCS